MELKSPWIKPLHKRNGVTTPNTTFRFDPALKQAVEELATKEAIKYNTYLSKNTIAFNLMTRNSLYLDRCRLKLAQRIEQLKTENNDYGNSRTDTGS